MVAPATFQVRTPGRVESSVVVEVIDRDMPAGSPAAVALRSLPSESESVPVIVTIGRKRVAVLHRLAAALAERVGHHRHGLDREVGVREVEEDVTDRLDLDPRLCRADVGQRDRLGAVVRRCLRPGRRGRCNRHR